MAIQTPPQADLIVIGGGAAGLFGAIHAGRSGARVLVLEGARTLGAKVLVAGGGGQLHLRGQVAARVFLREHVGGRHLRVAEVPLRVRVVDPAGQVPLVVAVGQDEPAPLAEGDGGAGVLAPREDHAGRDVGVLQQLEGDEPVVSGRFRVVQNVRELLQVPRAQEMGDIGHRFAREFPERLRLDAEELAVRRLDGADGGAQVLQLPVRHLLVVGGRKKRGVPRRKVVRRRGRQRGAANGANAASRKMAEGHHVGLSNRQGLEAALRILQLQQL